jgi:hypothetical protein
VQYEKLSCRKMESGDFQTQLIHGLPDEIALLCLARVPRQYHNALMCVSRGWKALLCSDEWRSYRKRNNLDESWIYVICRGIGFKCYVVATDPMTRCLKVIQVMESPSSAQEGVSIETLDGCSWPKDANDEVYCYDAASNHWSKAAPVLCLFSLMHTFYPGYIWAALSHIVALISGAILYHQL